MEEITPIRSIGSMQTVDPGAANVGVAQKPPSHPRPPPQSGGDEAAAQIETISPAMRRVRLQYQVDVATHKVTVLIVDVDSDEILRTVPPDELARELARLRLNRQ